MMGTLAGTIAAAAALPPAHVVAVAAQPAADLRDTRQWKEGSS